MAKAAATTGGTTKKRGAKPLSSDPAQAFVQVSIPQVNNLLKGIKRLKSFALKSKFEFSKDQSEKIFAALTGALNDAKKAYETDREARPKGGDTFSF